MRTRHSTPWSNAFTLVELLVVIGIISVLISVLLPALGKARQQANLIDCQARLHQMGQALQIYVTNNRGLVPWGVVDRTATAFWTDPATRYDQTPSNREQYWWWHFTFSEIFNKNILQPDGFVHGISPVFRDKDTMEVPVEARFVNHYTCNPRILYQATDKDSAPYEFSNHLAPETLPQNRVQRKISSIKPSTVFVIWDGPQILDYGYNTYEIANALDGNGISYGHCFCLGSPNPIVKYARAVTPGWQGQNIDGKALQKKYNIDLRQAFNLPDGWLSHLRFRHMNNTELNALCLDGHVEMRRVGEVKVLDICTNYH